MSTILVVNDMPEQLRFLSYLLGDAGYRVILAHDGCEGLAAANRERPDLIVSDVNMPNMDGIQLCSQLKSNKAFAQVPFVLMSSERRDTPSALEGLKAGADEYIELPYDNQRLLAKVSHFIEQKRIGDALLESNDALQTTAEQRAIELQITNTALHDEIAERKRMEQSLRESEERYRRLLEAASEGIGIVDKKGNWSYVNERLAAMLDQEPDSMLSRPVASFIERDHADHLLGAKRTYDTQLQRGDGTSIWALVSSSPTTTADGQHSGSLEMVTDITERKQAEETVKQQKELLQKIFNHIPVMIVVLDEGGSIKLANRAWEQASGWSVDASREIGADILEKLYPDPFQREQVRHSISSANGEWGDTRMRVRDGSAIDTCWTYVRLSDGTCIGIGQNESERRHTENALRESEERLTMVLESARMGTWDWNVITNSVMISDNLIAKGLQPTFEAWINSVHVDDRAGVESKITECLNGASEYDVEFRSVFPDGHVEWTIAKGKAFQNTNGATTRILGISLDITERKRAEEALAQSETRFQLISRATNDAVWDWELDTGKVWWNESIQTLFGYAPEDVGDDAAWWYEHIHPEDVDRIVCNVDAAIENNWNCYSGEYRFQRFDGTYAPTLERGYVISDEKGNPVRILGSMMDLTEFKKSEEALRQSQVELNRQLDFTSAITASFGDGLYALDTEGRLTFMNRAAETMLGYKPEDWIGHNIHDKLHPSMANGSPCLAETCPLWSVLTSGQTIKMEEDAFTTSNGDVISVSYISSHIITFGEVSGAVLSFRDITERRALETQLRHSQKLESIGQLAAGIAHEINTPIQYVGDNIRFIEDGFQAHSRVLNKYEELSLACKANEVSPELLIEVDKVINEADVEYLAEEMPKAIEQSLDGIKRIAKIVQSMKDFAHPGSAEKQAVDLNRAIESTITVARNEWKYIAEMELNLDGELPSVPCHLGEFNQVILNLIVNAAHAITDVVGAETGRKGIIKIATRRNGDWVDVTIADSGAGIPEAIRPRIFDPFFTTKTVGKGTGQGLAISHNVIVEKHSGAIFFETEEGVGTTFTVRLPLFDSADKKEQEAA